MSPEGAGALLSEPTYASLGNRAMAALIDNLFWIFAWFIYVGSVATAISDNPEVIGLVILAYLTVWFNYFAIAEWRFGQTIGKNALKLRVVKDDGSPLTYNSAALRNLLRLIDVLVIGWVMIASSARHQRLGDRAAHTLVVRDPGPVVSPPASES